MNTAVIYNKIFLKQKVKKRLIITLIIFLGIIISLFFITKSHRDSCISNQRSKNEKLALVYYRTDHTISSFQVRDKLSLLPSHDNVNNRCVFLVLWNDGMCLYKKDFDENGKYVYGNVSEDKIIKLHDMIFSLLHLNQAKEHNISAVDRDSSCDELFVHTKTSSLAIHICESLKLAPYMNDQVVIKKHDSVIHKELLFPELIVVWRAIKSNLNEFAESIDFPSCHVFVEYNERSFILRDRRGKFLRECEFAHIP